MHDLGGRHHYGKAALAQELMLIVLEVLVPAKHQSIPSVSSMRHLWFINLKTVVRIFGAHGTKQKFLKGVTEVFFFVFFGSNMKMFTRENKATNLTNLTCNVGLCCWVTDEFQWKQLPYPTNFKCGTIFWWYKLFILEIVMDYIIDGRYHSLLFPPHLSQKGHNISYYYRTRNQTGSRTFESSSFLCPNYCSQHFWMLNYEILNSKEDEKTIKPLYARSQLSISKT